MKSGKYIKKVSKNPRNPDKKEKNRLKTVQYFLSIFGRINLFEELIKIIAKIAIKKAVLMLKIIVEIVCKSLFKK